MTTAMTSALILQELPHPGNAGRPVQIFADWQKACEHLRDHLLTAPECDAWMLVIPEYAQVVAPFGEESRWEILREAMASQGAAAQRLYDLYCAAIIRDSDDSAQLGWWRSFGEVTVAVGSSGILLVIEDILKTAFLPGQSEPEQTRTAKLATTQVSLARQRGMRSGRPERFAADESEKDKRQRAAREACWSDCERLYYRVFKPAIQFIRKCHHRQCDMNGKFVRRDYALLKDVLPPQSQLRFQHWVSLRDRCGRK